MPANLKKAKTLLGITGDISGIYKLPDEKKSGLRGDYQTKAIDSAKDTTEGEKKQIEAAHDLILSYLNLPNDLLTKLKSGEVSLQDEIVREAIINDPELLQQMLADKEFISNKITSGKTVNIVSDTESVKEVTEKDLLFATIEQGIIQQQDNKAFLSKLPEILQDGPIKMTDLVSRSPELKDAIMNNTDAFSENVRIALKEQVKINEEIEQRKQFIADIEKKFPQEIFAKAMQDPEYADRLLANKVAQKKLDSIALRSILAHPPNKYLYSREHYETEESLATFIASMDAETAQKLLKDPDAKPINILKVVKSLIEKGDVGDVVQVIRSDPDNNIVAFAQKHPEIAAAFATNPKLAEKLNNDEKITIQELHRNNQAVAYLQSHTDELVKLGIRDADSIKGITKDANGKYKLHYYKEVDAADNVGNITRMNLDKESEIPEEAVKRLAQFQANLETQQTPPQHQDTTRANPSPPEKPAVVPQNIETSPRNQDKKARMEALISKILSAIDPTTRAFKAELDASCNAIIKKGERPSLSVQPEKITLMEPFGKPPGSDADIAKVEMLVKAGKAAYGEKMILMCFDPSKKEFMQAQARKHGVEFADTPEKLAAIKAERAARLGTTITPSDTTQPTSKPTFGGLDTQAQQTMLDAQSHATKPLPPIPQKTEFQQALGALRSTDENVRREYLKTILTGNNQFFEIKDKGADGAEISIKDTSKLNDVQGKALAQAFVQASGKTLQQAQFDTDKTQKKIILNSNDFDTLKKSSGVDETMKKQQQTSLKK